MNKDTIEIEGWKLERAGRYSTAKRKEWTVSIDHETGALDIDCEYGATGCWIPTAVIDQLREWITEEQSGD